MSRRTWVAPQTRVQLEAVATGYLAKMNPSGELPVPIEEIIDFDEGIEVIPVEDLAIHGHEAYTARDKKTIYIDKVVFCHKVPYRLRYTLAHELSHILIHPKIFEAAKYSDVAGFKQFYDSIPNDQMKVIEQQAYTLAGLILVPPEALSEEYTQVAEKLEENGTDITTLDSDSLLFVAKKIGEKFCVSHQVIHRRAVADRLWSWDDISNP